ncbi:MAG TPA: hypothetical protein EYQ14_03910 [Gammaproteobacteria bacterium]|nr:hypothetical protein [Gammaproteobacteria bacterium]
MTLMAYFGGAITGFTLAVIATLFFIPLDMDTFLLNTVLVNTVLVGQSWISLNLGSSVWLFALVLAFYATNLTRLQTLVEDKNDFKQVVRLDQVSEVWIHLFVGIGVVWTAVGMRSALSTTLDVPQSAIVDAGQVLSRLVDGGILLALTTTIVGAIGGYLMRLAKTFWLGAELTEYYHQHERQEIIVALERLARIELLVTTLVNGESVQPSLQQEPRRCQG